MSYPLTRGAAQTKIIIAVVIVALIVIVLANRNGTAPEAGDQAAETADQTSPAFAEMVNYEITGIEPGAGIMINTETAVTEYDLEAAGWELKESSSAAMMAAVRDAIDKEEPVVATVWEPHALFAVADLRKLDDPQHIYNNPSTTKAFLAAEAPDWADAEVQSDVLATVVYDGFAEDAPAAAAFFAQFNVPADTQSQWIYELTVAEREPEAIAASYIEANRELVDSWKPAADVALGKEEIVLGIPPWPGATVKSRVVAAVLKELGYTTEVRELDIGIVYTSIADEQIDVNVAGWLPTTHQQYWEEKGDELEIAGINVTQTWLGLAVPSYADEDIQSIADLAEAATE